MASASSVHVLSLLLFLNIATKALASAAILCNEKERQALLQFKQALVHPRDALSSWVGVDCCKKWVGVHCDNRTGHVVKISLPETVPERHYPGEKNFSLLGSLLELEQLSYLDLSRNNFEYMPIPEFLGSFKKLKYLDLSLSFFGGKIPHQLGNISSLSHLDLSYNYDLKVDSLDWLAHLRQLKFLAMEYVNLSSVANDLQILNKLPSLSVLGLSNSGLTGVPVLSNLTSLTSLDLSFNSIVSKFPDWLVDHQSLVDLDLSSNGLKGPIPSGLGRFCNLQRLHVSKNNMDGEIFGLLENLSRCGMADFGKKGKFLSVRSLDFSFNNFTGTVPENIGQLSELVVLRILDNSLEGALSEVHFANLTKLESLGLSSNSFVLNISTDWVPPFKLKFIHLGSCDLGPLFPKWLRFQKDYIKLDLSNAHILDAIPDWFWNLSSQLVYLNVSQNNIYGRLPTSLNFSNFLDGLDFSSNQFEGPLPNYVSDAGVLDLSTNFFSGPIILNFRSIAYVSLSNNQLNGSIPLSLCDPIILFALDLSNNKLSGQFPKCWEDLIFPEVLDLSYNSLSGTVSSFGGVSWLKLNHNNFSGTFPDVTNPHSLVSLDLSNNKFSGSIPTWIGHELLDLRILNLRSNMFHGNIPPQLAILPSLQILYLADNQLSGSIPSTFGNFSGMKMALNQNYDFGSNTSKMYEEYMVVIIKRLELKYTKTLHLVASMDLSGNNLSGEIPKELAGLHQLHSLNLSGNHLAGKIPENIGELRQLQSLDLSRNNLSGTIPPSISKLTFLGSLNLSYNNLSGKIPSGNQIQTLIDPSIYAGNRDLCGLPVSESCPGEQAPRTPKAMDSGDEGSVSERMWLYVSIALGFVVGFWCFCGPLLLHRPWRIACHRFFDNLDDWLYVVFARMAMKIRKK